MRLLGFVLAEIVAVGIATGVASFLLSAIIGGESGNHTFVNLLLFSLATGICSPLFTAVPILVGALLLKLALRLQPERLRFWSLFTGISAAVTIYAILYRNGLVYEFSRPTPQSISFFGLIILPSLWVWQKLAGRYLR